MVGLTAGKCAPLGRKAWGGERIKNEAVAEPLTHGSRGIDYSPRYIRRRRLMRKLFAGLILGLLLLLPVAAAYASAPPETVEGGFTVPKLVLTSVDDRGGVCFVGLDAVFQLDGSFTGAAEMHLDVVNLGPCFEPAAQVFRAKGTYTGTVEAGGTEIEVTFDFTFQGTIDEAGHAEGRLVILNGTDGLVNIQGELVLDGNAGVDGDYSGKAHFSP
jgi:hypothetical protein